MCVDETGKERLSRQIDPFRHRCESRNAARIVNEQALLRIRRLPF